MRITSEEKSKIEKESSVKRSISNYSDDEGLGAVSRQISLKKKLTVQDVPEESEYDS